MTQLSRSGGRIIRGSRKSLWQSCSDFLYIRSQISITLLHLKRYILMQTNQVFKCLSLRAANVYAGVYHTHRIAIQAHTKGIRIVTQAGCWIICTGSI